MRVANADLKNCLEEARRNYVESRPISERLYQQAIEAMPGGNTRTVLFYTPFPAVLAGAEGCRVTDVDSHSYLDFLGEYSAGLYGHNNPVIQDAIRDALTGGIVLGGPNRYEVELANLIKDRFASIDLLRFCNSGTEANLLALSTAKMATGREKVLVFEQAYHGSVFYFGPGGSPINAPFSWVVAPYNDTETALARIEAHGSDLAAVLVEPMQGSGGCVPAAPEFLKALRDACTRHGTVLIFDEVMTSRSSPGGLQARLGIAPDMTTLGKYLGGGLTFGAFGGRRSIMERFDPRRPDAVAHAGTFNNNVLAMAAGAAGLREVFTVSECERLFNLGEDLRTRLNAAFTRSGAPMAATGVGSLLGLHFHVGSTDSAHREPNLDRDRKLKELLHLDMLARGIYFARRGFVSLSLPMQGSEIDALVEAMQEFTDSRQKLFE